VRVLLTIRHLAEVLASAAAVEAKREVITLARSGTGAPLFLWHGDCLGWGLYAFRLATMLDGKGPVYLLHSILNGNEGIETIEGMVQRQLPHIEAVAPDGPIRLAGYCHGGLAALEVAAQLEKTGRTVETVILIDSYSINARPIVRLVAPLIALAGHIVPGRVGFRLRRDGMLALWGLIRLLQGDTTFVQRLRHKVEAGTLRTWHQSPRALYLRAMARYVPRPVRTGIVCLLSEERAIEKACATHSWKRLASSVRSAFIQGEHHTCVSRHVGELAACLNRMSFHGVDGASSAQPPHAVTRANQKTAH
jgi:thioesterase domain-containing protein